MSTKIEMPKLSDTMTEGTVVRWLKKVGDQVEIGDEIAEIETDKATMAMEAFDEGTLGKILVEEGAKADIGSPLAILLEEGESLEDEDSGQSGSEAPADKKEAASDEEPDAEEDEAAEESEGAEEDEQAAGEKAKPQAKKKAAKKKAAKSADKKSADKKEPAKTKAAPAAEAKGSTRIKASPLARKMAESMGVDLAALSGSGPGGRIVKKDVEAAAEAAPAAEEKTSKPAPAAKPEGAQAPAAKPPAAIAPVESEEDQRVELSSMRRIIAERLLTSKTTIPHFYLHAEVDAAPLMEIRKQINAQAEASHGNKYTVNDFILKAVINALQAVPAANASFAGDHIVQFGHIGIAVAVAVDDGLVTPVVKDAASKSLLQISREVKDLAARAREGKLLPNEFDGGTITVSNLGAYGVEFFDAIINPPQAAIVSVGSIQEKPVVQDGELAIGLRMNVGLSGDHRVVDGAVGAQLLSEIKKLIENPALMLV